MKYKVSGRYVDEQDRSHTFALSADSADRRFLEGLVKAQYPAKTVFINKVSQ